MEILDIPLSQLSFVQKRYLMEATWDDPNKDKRNPASSFSKNKQRH
jgi:hypothetical protein